MADPTPLPTQRPSEPPNADIAADYDAPPSPTPAGLPVRQLYNDGGDDKREHTPNRQHAKDGLSSPPKKGARRSPFRTVHRSRSLPDPAAEAVCDLFSADAPTTPATVVLSPEQLQKLHSVITAIKNKPVSAKRAVLPVRKQLKPRATMASQGASMAKTAKTGRPKSNKSRSSFLNNNDFLANPVIRPHIFGGSHKELKYSEKEMTDHDRAFQRQLKFRFDEKRAKNKLLTADRTTRSMVDEDLDSNDAAYNLMGTVNFKELSRCVLEDILQCVDDTPLLLCISKKLDGTYEKILSDGAKQQKQKGVGGDQCKIAGQQFYCLRIAMDNARKHRDMVSGAMAEPAFIQDYKCNDGFVVRGIRLVRPCLDLLQSKQVCCSIS